MSKEVFAFIVCMVYIDFIIVEQLTNAVIVTPYDGHVEWGVVQL
jgi:hypothetical protein